MSGIFRRVAYCRPKGDYIQEKFMLRSSVVSYVGWSLTYRFESVVYHVCIYPVANFCNYCQDPASFLILFICDYVDGSDLKVNLTLIT